MIEPSTAERDARVVRRALRAGVSAWAAVGVVLVAGVLATGQGGRVGLVAVMAALVVGALVASAWLLVAAVVDLLADERPGPRRLLWTFGVTAFAFISPAFVLGAQGGG